jgi:putative ABC transport system substrate-binding protein
MNRRATLLALAALAAHGSARAQAPPAPMRRVAFLSNRSVDDADPYRRRFVDGMRQRGYLENRDYVLEMRYADNEQSKIAPAIREAVASRPDVMVVAGLYAAREARDATKTIPVVVATGSDLVDAGIVASYARPGGNITGVADQTDEAAVKRLELLKAALPRAERIGVVVNPDFPASPKVVKALENAARRLALALVMVHAKDRASLLAALDTLAKARVDAVLVAGDNNATANAADAIAHAATLRLPIAYFWPGTAEMGALFSYQADVLGNFERAAWYVDRILKGAKPGDLPVDLPKGYELVVNRKAAAELGITLPGAFLQRADRVVDTVERPAR